MHAAYAKDFLDWREQARDLLKAKISPDQVMWSELEQSSLFDDLREKPIATDQKTGKATDQKSSNLKISPEFLKRAVYVSHARGSEKWDILYRVLWKHVHGVREILEDAADPDVVRWQQIEKNLNRDIHKMHAFVRFRKLEEANEEDPLFVAWYEPDHFILKLATPFFARRFGSMRWVIATPQGVAIYDRTRLEFSGPASAEEIKMISLMTDGWEDIWRSYYSHIFNPARLKIKAMKNEMPVRFWKNLPEAKVIPELIRKSSGRVGSMHDKLSDKDEISARTFVPEGENTLADLKQAARGCRGCDLFEDATQTVFGEGSPTAKVVIVGEQPGDVEDQVGRPFMGPAGQVLRATLEQLNIRDDQIYYTNAVKHFRFQPARGAAGAVSKRRIHERPAVHQMRACHAWLEEEMEKIKPDLIVCLGSTAAHAVIGFPVSILKVRGTYFTSPLAKKVLVTYHPSYLLRLNDEGMKAEALDHFRDDLALIIPYLGDKS